MTAPMSRAGDGPEDVHGKVEAPAAGGLLLQEDADGVLCCECRIGHGTCRRKRQRGGEQCSCNQGRHTHLQKNHLS